jgi:hypothetical protein
MTLQARKQTGKHENYSNIVNCRTKIPSIFQGLFTTSRGISKFLSIYSTISRGTPNDIQAKPWLGDTGVDQHTGELFKSRHSISDSVVKAHNFCVDRSVMVHYSLLGTRQGKILSVYSIKAYREVEV